VVLPKSSKPEKPNTLLREKERRIINTINALFGIFNSFLNLTI
jgi:hypothetical protein